MDIEENDSLEALKREAEESLFTNRDVLKRELYKLAKTLGNFVSITKDELSRVFIDESYDFTALEKVGLVLCARFIGNKIREDVDPVVAINEVSEYAQLDYKMASARLSDLVREGLLERVDKGKYVVKSFKKAKKFIEGINEKYRSSP